MQFVYHEDAGKKTLNIIGETYTHLFKSRRNRTKTSLHVRNLQDNNLYMYRIESISKKEALLSLETTTNSPQKSSFHFTLGWSVVAPKVIEKTLPLLNEIGVSTIAFVYTDFSQKNFTINTKRLEKILINSCEQCGRSELMQFKILNSLEEYFESYPESLILDFGGASLKNSQKPSAVLVGCEGGFSEQERKSFDRNKIIGLQSPFILKSESATCAIASKILL